MWTPAALERLISREGDQRGGSWGKGRCGEIKESSGKQTKPSFHPFRWTPECGSNKKADCSATKKGARSRGRPAATDARQNAAWDADHSACFCSALQTVILLQSQSASSTQTCFYWSALWGPEPNLASNSPGIIAVEESMELWLKNCLYDFTCVKCEVQEGSVFYFLLFYCLFDSFSAWCVSGTFFNCWEWMTESRGSESLNEKKAARAAAAQKERLITTKLEQIKALWWWIIQLGQFPSLWWMFYRSFTTQGRKWLSLTVLKIRMWSLTSETRRPKKNHNGQLGFSSMRFGDTWMVFGSPHSIWSKSKGANPVFCDSWWTNWDSNGQWPSRNGKAWQGRLWWAQRRRWDLHMSQNKLRSSISLLPDELISTAAPAWYFWHVLVRRPCCI